MEARLKRLQRVARSRHDYAAGKVGDYVAAAIRSPDGILIATRQMQGDLIPAGCLFSSDKRPGTELVRNDRRATIFQLRAGATTVAIKRIIRTKLDQAGRSQCFNRDWDHDHPQEITERKREVAREINCEVSNFIAVSVTLNDGGTGRAVEIIVQLT